MSGLMTAEVGTEVVAEMTAEQIAAAAAEQAAQQAATQAAASQAAQAASPLAQQAATETAVNTAGTQAGNGIMDVSGGANPTVGNQVASVGNSGVVSDVGVNPDYQAWQNALKNGQFVQENPITPNVLEASGNSANPTVSQGITSAPSGGTANLSNADYIKSASEYEQAPGKFPPSTIPSAPPPAPPQSAFSQGLESVDKFMTNHPFYTGMGLYALGKTTGAFDQKQPDFKQDTGSPYLSSFKMSPNFKGSTAQSNVYKPHYASGGIAGLKTGGLDSGNTMFPQSQQDHTQFATSTQYPVQAMQSDYDAKTNPTTGEESPINMASGGVAHFYTGDRVRDIGEATNYFEKLAGGQMQAQDTAAAGKGEPGIYHDSDQDTRYKDALTASQIRLAKIGKQANTNIQPMDRSKPLGGINLAAPGAKQQVADQTSPEYAAQGGIMGYNLGGYAHGGNPRLLRGPGDGMSDDIPATIGNRQPARLADGEFVIPADVVSGLGNGSTEAGAKILHEMMNKIRKARTGTTKQGKQINPSKFIPKK